MFKEWRERIILSEKTIEPSFQERVFHKETPFTIKTTSKDRRGVAEPHL